MVNSFEAAGNAMLQAQQGNEQIAALLWTSLRTLAARLRRATLGG